MLGVAKGSHRLFSLHLEARLEAGETLVTMVDHIGPAAGEGSVQASSTVMFNPSSCFIP